MTKLSAKGTVVKLGPKEKSLYLFIENHLGSYSGDIAEKLNIGRPTVKKILTALVEQNLITKYGAVRKQIIFYKVFLLLL